MTSERVRTAWPTMYDLPSDDPSEPGLPDEFHGLQPQLLSLTLPVSQYSPQERFTGFDLNLYYDRNHLGWYKRPDWFLVVGVPRLYRGESLRDSYVVWDEQVAPIVVVEFLSLGTEAEDLGRFAKKPPVLQPGKPPCKFDVYETILQVPHYIVYDDLRQRVRYFQLVNGRYQEQAIAPTNPCLWIPELEMGLGLWQGEFRDSHQIWLRWCDRLGNWFPTDVEVERSAKESAQQQIEVAQQQIQQAVRNLLAMGLSVQQVAQAMGLSESEVQAIAASRDLSD